MKLFYTILLSFALSVGYTQVSFESYGLPLDTFVNNSEGMGFSEGDLLFNNSYNSNYMSFSEFALSTMRDTETQGFENQYSVISGSGANGTDTYAVGYSFSGTASMKINSADIQSVKDLQINNTTFTALTLLNGNGFSKKFGGETGDDPDFYLLQMTFYLEGEDMGETIDFYLADYRFEDNTMDYIITDWTTVDLSGVSTAYDEIRFSVSSSDVGAYGINTPTYFAVDEINTMISSGAETELTNFSIYPNPVQGLINIEVEGEASVLVYDVLGRPVVAQTIFSSTSINFSEYSAGSYFVKIKSGDQVTTKTIIKN